MNASPRSGTGSARLLAGFTWAVLFWLALPILVMVLFGFNDTTSRFNFTWQGFTLRWYRELFTIPDLTTALLTSLAIAAVATVGSTTLGTLIGLALGKYRFRGRSALDAVLFAGIATPEVAIGASLLSLFITLGIPRGVITILIAHVMFGVAYVAITVRARMSGFNRTLEEAARDLGAGPWTTFRKVTLPMIRPGVLAGALLAFALSIDDFIITEFNAGSALTFPLWVYGTSKVGTPPQVNVMGTLVFAAGLLMAVVSWLIGRKGSQSVGMPDASALDRELVSAEARDDSGYREPAQDLPDQGRA